MRWTLRIVGIAAALGMSATQATAQQIEPANHRRPLIVRPCPVPCPELTVPPVVDPSKKPTDPAVEPPAMPGMFGEGPRGGGAEMAQYNTNMFGDIIGGPSVTRVFRLASGATVAARVPVLSRGGFKIADNESPRPQDRIFVTYNFYDSVNAGISRFDAHREMIGFEKTFFDGNASFGMRLPFIQLTDNRLGLDGNQVGDLSMILKWAFVNNRDTGSLLSTGMVITVPSGEDNFGLTGPTIHSTLLQPYLGYIFNFDRFFIHGFSSVVVPTDESDATLWLNDIGVGFWLVRNNDDRLLRGIVPTFEAHILTALDHRGQNSVPVGVSDWVVLLGGVNFVFGDRGSSLGVAVGAPITGPNPYDFQAIVSLNLRF